MEEEKKSIVAELEAAKPFGEYEAGIQEYISPENVAIQCAIKHRFSDFIVNEIDEHGKVVWFTPENDLQKWKKANIQQTMPQGSGEGAGADTTEKEGDQPSGLAIELEEEKRQQLEKLMPEKEYKRFMEYVNDINEGAKEKTELFTFDESIEDKGIRSAIHQIFKSTDVFETDTLMEDGARRIRVFLKNSLSANKRKKLNIINRKPQEERDMPQYLQIVIQKTNVDTMQAIHYIAKKVKKYGKHFQIAGNKDKRGITTQRATIIRGDPEMLIRFQRARDWDNKIKVGTFERVYQPLRLGQLSGNRFSVALRFIPKEITNEQIAANVENLKKHGFINYFGMQRFGTYNVRTHQIGIENLHQNWIKVAHLILSQHPDGDVDQARRKKYMIKCVFQDGNIDEALKLLERRDRLEKSILLTLKRSPAAYYNAFQNIARNTRTIYIHAYQSYVWNRAVSERIRRHGRKVLLGDLVIEPEKAEIVEDGVNPDDLMIDQVDVDEIDLPEELDSTSPEGKKAQQPKHKSIEDALIEVTEENIHKYTLNDVVMPIVGYKTRMPNNEELKQIILGIMAEDKITEETFEKHTLLDSTSAWGSYRKIIGFASDIEYDVVEFQSMNEDLLTPDYNTETDPQPKIDRSLEQERPIWKALRLKFSLRQSSYATMLLREVTKMSSAFNVQSALSKDMNAV